MYADKAFCNLNYRFVRVGYRRILITAPNGVIGSGTILKPLREAENGFNEVYETPFIHRFDIQSIKEEYSFPLGGEKMMQLVACMDSERK